MMVEHRVKFPLYLHRNQFTTLTDGEGVRRWNEPKIKPGIRFGGVALVRLSESEHLGYIFVAGNDVPNEIRQHHNQIMNIQRVKQNTSSVIDNDDKHK